MEMKPCDADRQVQRERFARATAEVNEWRGRCLDAFTRAEAAIAECLLSLAAVEGRGPRTRLRHLGGQQLDDLTVAIAEDGPFGREGKDARPSLAAYGGYADRRHVLCHGTSKITLDQRGQWTAVLRTLVFKGGVAHRDALALDHREAEQFRDDVIRVSKDVCCRLGRMIGSLPDGGTAVP